MNPNWSSIKPSQFVALFAAFCISYTPPSSREPAAPQTSSQMRELSPGNLSVRISAKGNAFHAGDTLKLRVVLSNTGNDTIFVPNQIEMSGCARGSVRIFSLKGAAFPGQGQGCAADCGRPSEDAPKLPPIASVVVGDWVPLPPGYAYSRDIESYALGKPGKYLIGGDYTAVGIVGDCRGNYSAEDIAKLPYRLWTGQVDTNSIWIEVTKK